MYLLYITSEVNSTMRSCFIYHTDLGENFLFLLNLLFCSFSQFCKIAKLHSFNIQDERSTRFLWTTKYRIDHIIKCFNEENSIILGLFSQKNLLLCDMHGKNYGLLVKTIKQFPKIIYTASPGRVLTFDKHQICSASWHMFEWILIGLCFSMKDNSLCLGFNSFLLSMVSMVLLCVIFKNVWYLHVAFWVLMHGMFMFYWKQPAQRLKL